MFSTYSLFSDHSTTGVNGLSPKADDIVPTKHWNSAHSPIGQSPIQQQEIPSTPPHILGLFSPSPHSETLLNSLVLSPPSDRTQRNPQTEFSDDENDDFFFPSHSHSVADDDDFIQSMGGMEDVGNYSLERSSTNFRSNAPSGFQQSFAPQWQSLSPTPSPPRTYDSQFDSYNSGKTSNSPTVSQSAEHPHGEHPSRTLFVRNINSNVEEYEIRDLFEAYGPTRSIYTQCKHRGFVMVSFYDIRHAKNAIRHLQGRVLRRRKLDIHYSIPRNNPSEKDQNQGTLVVFNLDPSTSHDELLQIFGGFGEIKEIRETPNKKHHKFIEFYDVREAEKAMKMLNRTEIKGKKIKIEPSRPGGRKNNIAPKRGNDDVSSYGMNSYGMVSSSYDGPSYGSAELFSSYDIPSSYSPPSHYPVFHSSPPVRSMHPHNMQAPVQRGPRSISLPPGADQAKRIRSRSAIVGDYPSRSEINDDEIDQFVLNINQLLTGQEQRTTLMIRNIPNKYTQKMILAAVDTVSHGLYDFFYLPIDFKNKCNVGYAFINFIHPLSVVDFYQKFHQQKWEKFNSEKVCKISFARIQGKESLVLRFQNSSLMTEDKKCRPIIFYSEGPRMGQQEPFPVGSNVQNRDDAISQGTANFHQRRNSPSDERKALRLRSLSCNQTTIH